jgi:PAS domain S-box-containing protein
MQDQPWPFSAEDKLRLLPQLLNAVEQPIIATDLSGLIVYMNRPATETFGWSLQQAHEHHINKIVISPSILDSVQKYIHQLKKGEDYSSVYLIKQRDGSEVECSISASLIQSEQQTLVSLVFLTGIAVEQQQLQTANRILTEVDMILGNVVDYDAMLSKLVEFIIPQLADISVVHALQANGSLELAAIAPETIANNHSIYNWMVNDLLNDETDGLPAVIRSMEPILVTQVSPQRRAALAGVRSYMILPLITHRKIRGAMTFINNESGVQFNQNALELSKNLAINISIYLEKNLLYKESQMLKAELEQRVSERTSELREVVTQLKQSEELIQTLFRISNKLNSTLDVDNILDELAQEAIQLVNGESGFAGLRTPKGMNVKRYFDNGEAIPFEHTWHPGEGIPGWVLKYKVPYGTNDIDNDTHIQKNLAINNNICSIICTPIMDSIGEVIGFFEIHNKQGAEVFGISDQEMLLTLAPVASIAIQNALAYQKRLDTVAELKESSRQLEELAAKLESTREEERLLISRELHDQLGQSLTAMKFDMTSLSSQLKGQDESLVLKAQDILTQLNTMIKTVRRIATELRPGMLDDLGLVASIEWQADDFQKRTGIQCKVAAPSTHLNLNHDQALVLFRISQEALTNVARYAGADHVDIQINSDGEWIHLEIHDNGRGIRPEEIYGGQSLGLLGMRERVKHIGGIFNVQGIPEIGTTIKVSIPIDKTINGKEM